MKGNVIMSGHETHSRSLAKATSWRVTGTVDTIILASFFTGNFKIAVTIGATEMVTKIILYWIHERMWSRVRWGYAPTK